MTGEEIGREKKAKRIAASAIGATIKVLKDGDEELWELLTKEAGANLGNPSPETRKRVIEFLEGVAI